MSTQLTSQHSHDACSIVSPFMVGSKELASASVAVLHKWARGLGSPLGRGRTCTLAFVTPPLNSSLCVDSLMLFISNRIIIGEHMQRTCSRSSFRNLAWSGSLALARVNLGTVALPERIERTGQELYVITA